MRHSVRPVRVPAGNGPCPTGPRLRCERPPILHRWVLVMACAVGGTLHPERALAQTAVAVSAQIGSFHVAVANYYGVPQREVIVVRERRIRDEEIPVAFFIAQRARVTPATVVDLHLRGMSWWDISLHYGIGPEVYYVPVSVAPGPPYGKAYGHYKKKSRKHWNAIVLSDDDIVNLVQLRFLSDYYQVPPERVIDLRARQGDFVVVHAEVSRHRAGEKDRDHEGKNGKGRGATARHGK